MEYRVIAGRDVQDEYEGQEYMGDFDCLVKAKTFAKDILVEDGVEYTLVYNIDQELVAEFFGY
tara:strand:- start:3285 stop:3473 length:189 start_codon:yes stop_codon:yes gene_type:complete